MVVGGCGFEPKLDGGFVKSSIVVAWSVLPCWFMVLV